MAIPDLHPSRAELVKMWTRKIVFVVGLLILELVTFLGVLARPPFWIGLITAPVLAFVCWQLVSRILTGEYFSFSLNGKVSSSRQLADVLCTVGFSLNALFFVYHMATWYRLTQS